MRERIRSAALVDAGWRGPKTVVNWPEWWDWELELSPHLLKRMVDRGFSEVQLRLMMEDATGLREGDELGRWIAETRHDADRWEVVVEPDSDDRLLVVITAYPVQNT